MSMNNLDNEALLEELRKEGLLLKNELSKLYTIIPMIEKIAPREYPENYEIYNRIDENLDFIVRELNTLKERIGQMMVDEERLH